MIHGFLLLHSSSPFPHAFLTARPSSFHSSSIATTCSYSATGLTNLTPCNPAFNPGGSPPFNLATFCALFARPSLPPHEGLGRE